MATLIMMHTPDFTTSPTTEEGCMNEVSSNMDATSTDVAQELQVQASSGSSLSASPCESPPAHGKKRRSRCKIKVKKLPQRGLGVAQLEKLRIQEQHHTQQQKQLAQTGGYYTGMNSTYYNSFIASNPSTQVYMQGQPPTYGNTFWGGGGYSSIVSNNNKALSGISNSILVSESLNDISIVQSAPIFATSPLHVQSHTGETSLLHGINTDGNKTRSLNVSSFTAPTTPFLVQPPFQGILEDKSGASSKELSSFQNYTIPRPNWLLESDKERIAKKHRSEDIISGIYSSSIQGQDQNECDFYRTRLAVSKELTTNSTEKRKERDFLNLSLSSTTSTSTVQKQQESYHEMPLSWEPHYLSSHSSNSITYSTAQEKAKEVSMEGEGSPTKKLLYELHQKDVQSGCYSNVTPPPPQQQQEDKEEGNSHLHLSLNLSL